MVASAEAITQDSEKYVEQLLQLFRRFSLLVNQVDRLRFNFIPFKDPIFHFQKKSSDEPYDTKLLDICKVYIADASKNFFPNKWVLILLQHFWDTKCIFFLISGLFKLLKEHI